MKKIKQVKKGFTLAETLISLVIIGVIAAITVPAVMNNINTKQKEEKIKNVYHKLSKSTDKMLGVSGMNGYSSTEEFLNTFKNHLSIAKICKPDKIQDCWGSKQIIMPDGSKYDVTNIKKTRDLKISKSKNPGYKDIMGFVMNDGTPFIISYDTTCDMSVSQGKVWSKNGMSSSTNCISGVFDYNGGKKPNKLSDDIKNFNNSGGLGSKCAVEVGDKCLTAPIIATSVSKTECDSLMATGKYGINHCYFNPDYWAGAVKECGGTSNMTNKDDLKKIAQEIYGEYGVTVLDKGETSCNSSDKTKACFTSGNSAAQKYQIYPGDWFWSTEQSGYTNPTASRTFFENGTTYGHYDARHRRSAGGKVFCWVE